MNAIPSGRALLGWDASPSAIPHGTRLHRISHPQPDSFIRASQQTYASTLVSTSTGTCTGAPRGPYIYSTYFQGGGYPGSSGAPAILAGGYIVGQLKGACGPAPADGCDSRNAIMDGALSATYPFIAGILNPATSTVCSPDNRTACLLNGRFKATVRYRGAFDNNSADTDALVKLVNGFASPSNETAFFYFANANNIEMLVKLLDQGNTDSSGRPNIAVLFGTATPLRIELTITDTTNGATKQFRSDFNQMRGTTDFTAFVK